MPTRLNILGTRAEWLIDVHVGGEVLRFATRPAEITDARGRTYLYREGLDDLGTGYSTGGSVDLSIGVEIAASSAWASFVGAFATLERSRCVIRRWWPGQLLDAARVILDGELRGFSYGDEGEPVSFAVVRSVRTQSRLLPSSGMVVDGTTWPVRGGWAVDDSVRGQYYPVIIGCPGGGGTSALPATPGLLVETSGADTTDKLLIAGHRVMATEVTVYDYTDADAPEEAVLPVLHGVDGVGRTIAYVEPGGSFSAPVAPGGVYLIGWSLDNPGLRNPRTGAALRGAGDVIEWMLRTWSDAVLDGPRFSGVRDRLNAYKIDTFLNEPTDPLEWVRSEVLPLVPAEPRQGESGLYFYTRPAESARSGVVARLDAAAGQVERASAIEVDGSDLVNEVTVEYRADLASGSFRQRVTVSAEDGVREDEFVASVDDSRVLGSYRARLSQARYGRLPVTVQAHAVYEPATAVRIAQDIVSRQALPRRFVEYQGGPELEALEIGQQVEITDSAVRLASELATVLDVVPGAGSVMLSLELVDDPVLARRATA
jgi:hypothetical protein